MAKPAMYLHIEGFEGFDKRIDFDKKRVRKGMQKVGRIVQREGRKLAVSGGDYPKRKAGLLARSIKVKVSRSGFLVRIAPQKIAGMRDFYPAYLNYGVKNKHGGWRIRPKGNYMADALERKQDDVRHELTGALDGALSIK
ncbi:hypothetical protein V8G57_15650 [Collimonas sp. H4R21]|jgi:hypothetical protein|uniref:HK97 gp10 family phage protein n=1 Tax=Collimonas rhizosphaerae TaxID=3126357 RepID=A0ABU9PXU8_9BURK